MQSEGRTISRNAWLMRVTAVVFAFSGTLQLRAIEFPAGMVPVNRGESATATSTANSEIEKNEEVEAPQQNQADKANIQTRPDARTMTLAIPALRGQILDRYGEPLAQNIVVWVPALQYRQFQNVDRDFVVAWGRQRINKANEIFGIDWKVTDDALWEHYRHRRWLAMPVTHIVKAKRKKLLEDKLIDGLILQPIYQRYYPQKEYAAHLIGYVGSKGKLEKGPINYGDPIFEFTEGRAGLEKLFDKDLTGVHGLLQKQYDSSGAEVLREIKRRPKQGNSLITTIDLAWQKRAEEVLAKHAKKGALVILDVQTGEVVAMASRPSYDLNSFVPFISSKDYKALSESPEAPLFGRAFQGAYPPASTFKAVVALAGLSNQVINKNTQISCPAYIQLGKHQMYDWSKKPAGMMDVVKGLYRSNNVFFIKLGISTRPQNIINMAKRLGYGEKSGLPLVGEAAGLLPSDEYMVKHHKRKMTDGDTANMSIGQGVVLASPLQVAQGMACIANGGERPKLRLVSQIQDANGKILEYNKPETRGSLGVTPEDIALVQEGLMKVVNDPSGTGKAAALDFTVVCGKTGTAQWGPEGKKQYLGWFAGFFPLERPKYAFAMVYEGRPGERVSGGGNAAPMVSAFFGPIEEEVKNRINPPSRALVVEEDPIPTDPGEIIEDGTAVRAIPVEEEGVVPIDPPAPRAIPVEEDDAPPLPPVDGETGNTDAVPTDEEDLPPPINPGEEPDGDGAVAEPPARAVPVEE